MEYRYKWMSSFKNNFSPLRHSYIVLAPFKIVIINGTSCDPQSSKYWFGLKYTHLIQGFCASEQILAVTGLQTNLSLNIKLDIYKKVYFNITNHKPSKIKLSILTFTLAFISV